VAQVVLPGKHEALSSNPSTDKKRGRKGGRKEEKEARRESERPGTMAYICNPSSSGGGD
jgi:hypothetical protein